MYEIYVINLDRHTDRLRFMAAQFEALGVPFERVRAVNGYDPAEIAKAGVAPYSPLPAGEVGCFESHRQAWQRIVDRNLPGAYILEDDVAVASDFASLRYAPELLDRTDIIKLDTYPRESLYAATRQPLAEGRHLQRLVGTENSASCYFLTNRGARRLLERSRDYFMPVDLLMYSQESKLFWDIVVQKVFPSAAAQLRFLMEAKELPGQVADGIQTRRRTNVDPRRGKTRYHRLRLQLRRLMDWDFRAVRRRRRERNQAAVAAAEGVVHDTVLFHTDTRQHIDTALARMAS